jgi:hypothetical protein
MVPVFKEMNFEIIFWKEPEEKLSVLGWLRIF